MQWFIEEVFKKQLNKISSGYHRTEKVSGVSVKFYFTNVDGIDVGGW
jgi:hypothetical protein